MVSFILKGISRAGFNQLNTRSVFLAVKWQNIVPTLKDTTDCHQTPVTTVRPDEWFLMPNFKLSLGFIQLCHFNKRCLYLLF